MSGETEGEQRELADAIRALAAVVEQQGAILQRIAGHLGLEEQADDATDWRRLGLAEGERRSVTVLFADLVGFTAMSDLLDAEECQLVLKDTMSALAGVVVEHGGYVEKFIGDALCAIFGAPVAYDDEPERAARTALDMHALLAERAARRPDLPAVTLHAGINTGTVIAGSVGDGSQFGVTGDTINTAARLMGLATSGLTYCSAETARRLRRHFLLEEAGTHAVKGKRDPLVTYSLLRALQPGEDTGSRRLTGRLVGRDAEVARLRRVVERVVAGEGSTTVVVNGDPGSGKSRFLDELAALAPPGAHVLRASARVAGASPLGLIADALEPLIDAADAATREVLGPLASGGAVAAPPDLELALATLLLERSAEAPLLVLLDDVGQADVGSLHLLRFLTGATSEGRIVWGLTQRSGSGDVEVGGDRVSFDLGPLPDEAAADLLAALLPGALDAAQRADLVARAGGNPEFVEELALSLVDDGVVVQAGEGWALAKDLGDVELPGSVTELIESRIDALSTAARVTLQDAAVIGVRFSAELLAHVATLPAGLDSALAELSSAELVSPPDESEPFALWSFRSRSVRDVAYESLLRRKRPVAHRRVADGLLAIHPGEEADLAELLAHHHEAAGDVELAVAALEHAIERAEGAHAHGAAIALADRALRLWPGHDDAISCRLLEWRGVCRLVEADRAGAADLEDAIARLRRMGEPAEAARVADTLAWHLVLAHDLPAAEAVLAGDVAPAGAAVSRALARAALGDPEGAVPELAAAFDAATNDDPFLEGRAGSALGAALLWSGRAAEALVALRRALEVADADRFAGLARAAGGWAVTAAVEAGAHADALLLAGIHIARAVDDEDDAAAAGLRADLAELHRQHGDLEGAVALAEEAAAVGGAEAWLVLAACRLDAGDTEVGAELAAAEAALATDGWLGWRIRARTALLWARKALAMDDVAGVLAAVTEARHQLGTARPVADVAAADVLEGAARCRSDDPAGLALLEAAAARPQLAPYARAAANVALARAGGPAAAVDDAVVALDELAGSIPPDHELTGRVRSGRLANALEPLRHPAAAPTTPGG